MRHRRLARSPTHPLTRSTAHPLAAEEMVGAERFILALSWLQKSKHASYGASSASVEKAFYMEQLLYYFTTLYTRRLATVGASCSAALAPAASLALTVSAHIHFTCTCRG